MSVVKLTMATYISLFRVCFLAASPLFFLLTELAHLVTKPSSGKKVCSIFKDSGNGVPWKLVTRHLSSSHLTPPNLHPVACQCLTESHIRLFLRARQTRNAPAPHCKTGFWEGKATTRILIAAANIKHLRYVIMIALMMNYAGRTPLGAQLHTTHHLHGCNDQSGTIHSSPTCMHPCIPNPSLTPCR